MSIQFKAIDSTGKIVGLGSVEKNRTVLSKLASSINNIKNNIVNFLGFEQKNNSIEKVVRLPFSHLGNLKNYRFIEENNTNSEIKNNTPVTKEKKSDETPISSFQIKKSQAHNSHFSTKLKDSIEISEEHYPEENLYTHFDSNSNPKNKPIELNKQLWVSSPINKDEYKPINIKNKFNIQDKYFNEDILNGANKSNNKKFEKRAESKKDVVNVFNENNYSLEIRSSESAIYYSIDNSNNTFKR